MIPPTLLRLVQRYPTPMESLSEIATLKTVSLVPITFWFVIQSIWALYPCLTTAGLTPAYQTRWHIFLVLRKQRTEGG
jgi:hypothetical protein